jgi:hypothetical protein
LVEKQKKKEEEYEQANKQINKMWCTMDYCTPETQREKSQ